MDQGHIYSSLIQEKGGTKNIVGFDIYSANKAKLDPKTKPNWFPSNRESL